MVHCMHELKEQVLHFIRWLKSNINEYHILLNMVRGAGIKNSWLQLSSVHTNFFRFKINKMLAEQQKGLKIETGVAWENIPVPLLARPSLNKNIFNI